VASFSEGVLQVDSFSEGLKVPNATCGWLSSSWHGCPAHVESAFARIMVVASNFLIQRLPSLFRPGGPTLPLPVAAATGYYQTNPPPFSCSSPMSRSDGGEVGRGGFVFPSAFGSGVFPIATMESGRRGKNRPLTKSPCLTSHAIDSHTLRLRGWQRGDF